MVPAPAVEAERTESSDTVVGHAITDELRRLYEEMSTIAVVGCSTNRLKPANYVARYLQAFGYRVIPVNPGYQEVLGETCYPSLGEIPEPVDVVQFVRPAEEAPAVAEEAVRIGARCLWLQLGLRNEEAARIARAGGLLVIQDNCMGLVHGELGLGPGLALEDDWHRGRDPIVLREMGRPDPLLRIGAGPAEGRTITLSGSEVELGRTVEGEGRLPDDEQVSRRHARILRTEHGLFELEDLGSTNGTYVNGVRTPGKQFLAEGDTLQLGQTTLSVVLPDRPPSRSAVHDRLSLAAVTALRTGPPVAATDPAAFRAEFPVFERVAYMNTGTDGPVPQRALDAASAHNLVVLEQGRSGEAHRTQTQALATALRSHYAAALGCDPDEVALTGSTNDGVNSVVWGLRLRRRDEIITSDEEHPSLLGPLAAAKRRLGVDVKMVPFGEIAGEVGPRTRLIACSHVSWVSGRVVDTEALVATGVPLLLDGAQGLGAIPVDVRSIGCDYYAASGQKWLCGPDGSGCLYVRSDRTATLTPPWPSYFSLGDARGLSLGDPTRPLELLYHTGARRFDTGNIIGALATWALASLEVLEDAGWPWVLERAATLAAGLAEKLEARGVEVLPRDRTTLVSWRSGDADGLVERLAEERIVVRSITARGVVRASVGAWNTEEELERLAELVA